MSDLKGQPCAQPWNPEAFIKRFLLGFCACLVRTSEYGFLWVDARPYSGSKVRKLGACRPNLCQLANPLVSSSPSSLDSALMYGRRCPRPQRGVSDQLAHVLSLRPLRRAPGGAAAKMPNNPSSFWWLFRRVVSDIPSRCPRTAWPHSGSASACGLRSPRRTCLGRRHHA